MPLMTSPTPVLKIEHLTRCFGSLMAVNDVSFEVYEGEILGLLGPNGAGKTTTISMLCGLLQPDSGKIFYQDRPIKDHRQAIGMCPQSIVIWKNLTCLLWWKPRRKFLATSLASEQPPVNALNKPLGWTRCWTCI